MAKKILLLTLVLIITLANSAFAQLPKDKPLLSRILGQPLPVHLLGHEQKTACRTSYQDTALSRLSRKPKQKANVSLNNKKQPCVAPGCKNYI